MKHYFTHDNLLMAMMAFVTVGWATTAAVVWQDVLRNRDATRRGTEMTATEIKTNREIGRLILDRVDRIEQRLPPPPATQP